MINAKDSKNTFYILNKKVNIPLVLIHGVGLNHKIWEPQINSFNNTCLLYTSPSPRDRTRSRMPSSA